MKKGDYVIIKTKQELEDLGYGLFTPFIFAFCNKLGRIEDYCNNYGSKYYRIKIGSNDKTWFPKETFIKYKGGL